MEIPQTSPRNIRAACPRKFPRKLLSTSTGTATATATSTSTSTSTGTSTSTSTSTSTRTSTSTSTNRAREAPMSILSVVQRRYTYGSKAHDEIYNSKESYSAFELSRIGL